MRLDVVLVGWGESGAARLGRFNAVLRTDLNPIG